MSYSVLQAAAGFGDMTPKQKAEYDRMMQQLAAQQTDPALKAALQAEADRVKSMSEAEHQAYSATQENQIKTTYTSLDVKYATILAVGGVAAVALYFYFRKR